MNHDVILDKYGRLYQIPYELSLLKHDVFGYCLNYRRLTNNSMPQRATGLKNDLLRWESLYAGLFGIRVPLYINRLISEFQQQRPDAIIASSDVLHAILAHNISRRTKVPFFLDLYDNYESFGMCKIPGLRWAYRRALRACDGIFTVSSTLHDFISTISPNTPVHTIESTISAGCFQPDNKLLCRQRLGLPLNAKLIGTAGALSTNRGTEYLYDAFKVLRQQANDVYLVLAGPTGDNPPPRDPNILYLGELPHESIPSFFNALDVAVICMKNDNFGKYAFPQKAYEILSCEVPVVCARIGAISALLKEHPQCLYEPDSSRSLAEKITLQLSNPFIPEILIPTWAQQAEKIANTIQASIER
ncbi:glycosyltransferase family 4 protein [Desulfosediminicola sp.]|uniref:glycosyltransferase family 4 protein n=1 Tax=Desulfosediminicola sp. TaxID=2886825 RepID=UPI003AF22E26